MRHSSSNLRQLLTASEPGAAAWPPCVRTPGYGKGCKVCLAASDEARSEQTQHLPRIRCGTARPARGCRVRPKPVLRRWLSCMHGLAFPGCTMEAFLGTPASRKEMAWGIRHLRRSFGLFCRAPVAAYAIQEAFGKDPSRCDKGTWVIHRASLIGASPSCTPAGSSQSCLGNPAYVAVEGSGQRLENISQQSRHSCFTHVRAFPLLFSVPHSCL